MNFDTTLPANKNLDTTRMIENEASNTFEKFGRQLNKKKNITL